jgi:1,4-alpha-glucan branching enzyme
MALITFRLFAPYNAAAEMVASFHDWQPQPMTKQDDGYFVYQTDLADGEYGYRYRIQSRSWFFEPDAWQEIVDPDATVINEEESLAIVRVHNGAIQPDDYIWQHDDVPLVPNRDLVIYELHVADFSGGEPDQDPRGKYVHVIEKLDYLKALGINALELMPIKAYPGTYSWGYNPRYFCAPEPGYGSSADLKALVDACHSQGIRVILDCVFNHADTSCPLAHIDHDYWFHHEPKDPEMSWGPEFNYDAFDEQLQIHPARQFVTQVMRHWLQTYHLDGIRYDAARQLAHLEFLQEITHEADHIAGIKPFFNVGEFIPDEAKMARPTGPFESLWHESFYHVVVEHLTGERWEPESLKDVLHAARQGYPHATSVVNYLGNHDHSRLLERLAEKGLLGEAAFQRVKAGVLLLLTAWGIPMLWMGEEFGEYREQTQAPSKLRWGLLAHEDNQNLHAWYQGVLQIRQQQPALRSDAFQFLEGLPEEVIAYLRGDAQTGQVLVLLNLGEQPQTVALPAGNWLSLLAPDTTCSDEISLPGFEGVLLQLIA